MLFDEGILVEEITEFLALAETLNFKRAAEALYISQPTLTRHIAALEKKLGFELFDRRRMVLTKAGEAYAFAMNKLMIQYKEITDSCRAIAMEDVPAIIINTTITSEDIFTNTIYETMVLYHQQNPFQPIPQVYPDRSKGILESVKSGEANIGIVYVKPSSIPPGFAVEHLIDCPLVVYVHHDNPLPSLITVDDLADCYLVSPANPYLQATFEGAVELMKENGIEPHSRSRYVSEFDQIPSTLQEDEFLLKGVLGDDIFTPARLLRELHFKDPVPECHVYAVYEDTLENPWPGKFVRLLKSQIASLKEDVR